MPIKIDEKFASAVDAVARELVSTEHFGSASLIKTPLMYPSGASAVVQVTQHGERFFVTDMGLGQMEADMIGASVLYANSAKPLAEHFGIRFDNQAFFIAEANKEQLAGAVTIVANCSSEAAAIAAFKAAERRFEEESDILYRRLTTVFPKTEIVRNVDFVGSSTHKWPVATMVTHRDRVSLFEPVSKHHTSVVNAAVKFNDIARLDNPPQRVAVVKKKAELGNYLNVLAQSANVIEYEVPDATFIRLAEAA
ncbi:hypothetical protein [Bradyrhizobium sp. Bra64]|uniref:hypothetical protein n=1 Tax=Bradyrhizobium sp. Bra64 TaxID=2926009 RepID=UPI00211870AF|nr:hypothetical protein [Bradyrhizobium sp. Bra64]